MPEEDRNIYKIARRNAGITQEAAAEQLGISVESVRAYETGQRIPPNHVVSRMVICYNAQRLAVQHVNLYDEYHPRDPAPYPDGVGGAAVQPAYPVFQEPLGGTSDADRRG